MNTAAISAVVVAFIGGWMIGWRRGYSEAVADSSKLDVVTNKLQAMRVTGKLECPRRAARRSLPAEPGQPGNGSKETP